MLHDRGELKIRRFHYSVWCDVIGIQMRGRTDSVENAHATQLRHGKEQEINNSTLT